MGCGKASSNLKREGYWIKMMTQAGVLTSGSISPSAFPTQSDQWQNAGFVPGYSSASVPDFHGLPVPDASIEKNRVLS